MEGDALNTVARIVSQSLSVCATLLFRTHRRRWARVARQQTPPWDARNRIIGGLIAPGSSVLDLGCGAQSLRRYLPGDCRYQPCDVVQETPDVIPCDFNAGVYPTFETPFDYVVCSGVFEYVRKPEEFLGHLSRFARIAIVSYHPFVSGSSRWNRLAFNWVNHFTEVDLHRLFDHAGLEWTIAEGRDSSERIYELRRRA